jgi:formyltetrahydrofolate deformylase
MQVILTAVGPDNRGLADPIVHPVTSAGASIARDKRLSVRVLEREVERCFARVVARQPRPAGPPAPAREGA